MRAASTVTAVARNAALAARAAAGAAPRRAALREVRAAAAAHAKPQRDLVSRPLILGAALKPARAASFSEEQLPRFRLAAAAAAAPAGATATSASAAKRPDMFCFQCEQTRDVKGCTTVGVCGKTPETAALQDLLVHMTKGVSTYAHLARQAGLTADEVKNLAALDEFVLTSLFSTMTNVNFDSQRMIEYLQDAVKYRAEAKALYEKAARRKGVAVRSFAASDHPTNMQLAGSTKEALERQGHTVGVLERRDRSGNPDLSGLIELSTYGLKGTAAYAHHALVLKQTSEEVFAEVHRVLYELSDPELTVDRALKLSLDVGGLNLKVMELLDRGGTSRYGHPTPTQVRTTPVKGKAILVSGHDLRDLELILEQTAGKGINVYTHGEMLPAHGYPKLRAFPHLAGHYGGAWQLQKFEFGNFPGPIIMTTNCIIEPRQSYKHRIFTRSVVGWPGVSHIEGDDMSAVVRAAMETPGFEETEQKAAFLTTGFARNAILGVADKVVQAVKDKKISRFFVIGGCDGSEAERNYFKDLALATPKDSVILTLGCAKYRFNRLPLGNVPGLDLPRLLDCGQCNDAYSAIAVASALANAFKTDVNSLPLSLNLSWLEQKACAVLLTLLHLGIKNIRLGPNLPAFATPNMLNILSSKFNLMPVGNVAEDLANMQAGK